MHEPADSACDDGKICNGNEACSREVGCTAGAPPDCRDDVGCTADFCLDSLGGCVNMPIDIVCSDRNACRVEQCDAESGCSTPQPDRCDDGNACTSDSCSASAGCVNTPLVDGSSCDGDGDVCNGSAVCSDGQCRAVQAPDCDDGRVCNGAEECDRRLGCIAGHPRSATTGFLARRTPVSSLPAGVKMSRLMRSATTATYATESSVVIRDRAA